jgi:hypothetical protein
MIERVESRNELAAPCGLYCGVCAVYVAHNENDQESKRRLAATFGLTLEDIKCGGCRSGELFAFCQSCQIRSCVFDKEMDGCHQCNEFPCEFIEKYPLHHGRRVMLRAVPARRELGIDRWIEAEQQRYRCPYCGARAFMGTEECWNCKEPVDVD